MPQFTQKPAITTLQVTILPEARIPFVDWQAKLNTLLAGFPGFISLEFLATPDQQDKWVIVQRFYDSNAASLWSHSVQHGELMRELHTLVSNGIEETTGSESGLQGGVTELIISQISPENEAAFRQWSARMHQVEAKFPGFRGVYLQSPSHSGGHNWITLLQFDSADSLDRWLASSERREVLKEAASLVTSLEIHRVVSPYAGWFASIAKTGEIPSVWKQTMIVLLGLFPIVMLELKYLSPWTAALNSSLGTFIGNAISVTLISFPMMPILISFLGWWLSPGDGRRFQKTFVGTLVVLLLYVIEIGIFWNLL